MLMQPTSPTTEPRKVLIVVTTDVEPGEGSIPKLEGANVRVVAPLTQLSRLQWPDADKSWLEEGASLKAVAAFNLPVARVVVDTSGKAGDSTPATTH